MKLLIDSANIFEIKTMLEIGTFSGVTTNPSLIAKEGSKNPISYLKSIKELLDDQMELHVQVVKETTEDIIDNAELLARELGKETFIKIPLTKDGAIAIKHLKEKGLNITATAIYSIQQVLIACNLGVDYIAPYVNRMHNLSINGTKITKEMHNLIINNNYNSKLLAASFKNTEQLTSLAEHGIYSATISFDVFEQLFKNDIVDGAVEKFIDDFNQSLL